jgi:hypothetical protein
VRSSITRQQKCDVFAAGIIFLEIISLQDVCGLYDLFYPSILQKNLPKSLLVCMRSLEEVPHKRPSFQDMFEALTSDTSTFEDVEDSSGAMERLENGVDEILIHDALLSEVKNKGRV